MTKKQERWRLEMELRRWQYRGGVIRRFPSGVPCKNPMTHVIEPITAKPVYRHEDTPEVELTKSLGTEAIQRLFNKTGLRENQIPKRLKTRADVVRSWLDSGTMPKSKYELLIKTIKEERRLRLLVENLGGQDV